MSNNDNRVLLWAETIAVVVVFGALVAWAFYSVYRDDKRVETAVKELQSTASTDPWAASERLSSFLDDIHRPLLHE